MMSAAVRAPSAETITLATELSWQETGRLTVAALPMPAALYAIAVLVRLAAVTQIGFPLTEGSAYYVAVARNLVEGRGLVIDALWSYATPPLVLPRPAFELWQPLTSFIAAVPMAILGTSFGAAQIGAALAGILARPAGLAGSP